MTKLTAKQKIQKLILDKLDEGIVPWRVNWKVGDQRPINFATKKPYTGANFWLLGLYGGSRYWLGLKQANQLGGKIKKGTPGAPIIMPLVKQEDVLNAEGKAIKRDRVIGYRCRYVWNLANIEGIELDSGIEEDAKERVEASEIVRGYKDRPRILHDGTSPAYSPKSDVVFMPRASEFCDEKFFYSTMFHELGHSTGHEKRLSRKGVVDPQKFGNHEYAVEELVAEFCSAYLSSVAGFENEVFENNAAYIQSWHKIVQNNPDIVLRAAGQGETAASYILGESS